MQPTQVQISIDGATQDVAFTGQFNRDRPTTTIIGGKSRVHAGIRQQEVDASEHGRDKLTFRNGPEQAAIFNALGQELADIASEVVGAERAAIAAEAVTRDTLAAPRPPLSLRRLHGLATRNISSGASNTGPTAELRSALEAIDPRFGPLLARYMEASKQAIDIGSPRVFQEDLSDIVRALDYDRNFLPLHSNGAAR